MAWYVKRWNDGPVETGRAMRSLVVLLGLSLLGCGGDGTGADASPPSRECGGLTGKSCRTGLTCVDNPLDSCDPNHGGADCPGLCLDVRTAPMCGGIAGLVCSAGQYCVDDPNDGC